MILFGAAQSRFPPTNQRKKLRQLVVERQFKLVTSYSNGDGSRGLQKKLHLRDPSVSRHVAQERTTMKESYMLFFFSFTKDNMHDTIQQQITNKTNAKSIKAISSKQDYLLCN